MTVTSQSAKTLRIIVADDDRDAVSTLALLLRDEGHEVGSVHSGRLVMGAVLDFKPDAVILDIHLPDLSGWEIARTIRNRHKRGHPLLIGVSGEYKKSSDKILAEILGFDHYLLKPYDPNELLALLEPMR